jgi:methyl-accepting chemotaxis protein
VRSSWFLCFAQDLRGVFRSLNHLLECGLFELEKGEQQMFGQRSARYATTFGTHLLAKVHQLQSSIEEVDCCQNYPLGRLDEQVNFMGEALDKLGRFIDELNSHVDTQDTQIEQLTNMVNDLVGKVEDQAKEIKMLKTNQEEH